MSNVKESCHIRMSHVTEHPKEEASERMSHVTCERVMAHKNESCDRISKGRSVCKNCNRSLFVCMCVCVHVCERVCVREKVCVCLYICVCARVVVCFVHLGCV